MSLRFAQAHYGRELANWMLLSVGLGLVEGAVAGAVAQAWYTARVDALQMALALALIAGAPAYANLFSFAFARLALGRDKIKLLVQLQALTMIAVASLALIPPHPTGLWLMVGCCAVARIGWAGVVTVRTTVWRQNFPDHARARLTSRLVAANALTMAICGAVLAACVAHGLAHYAFVAGGLVGLLGALNYSKLKLRRHRLLLRRERALRDATDGDQWQSGWRALLASDPAYASYLRGMFIFGTGNLMLTPMLLVVLEAEVGLDTTMRILLLSTVPLLILPLAVAPWARLLDRVHIVEFRAWHAWSFVAVSTVFAASAVSGFEPGLWLASVLLGIAYAGGALGWNLGHNDYASPERATLYMGIHVTLTGIRGLLAPLLATLVLWQLSLHTPSLLAHALLLPMAMNLWGARYFQLLARARRRQQQPT